MLNFGLDISLIWMVKMKDKRFLFVVSFGRSGSTLLQGLLNSIPGYVVSGENDDALSYFYRFYRCMSQGRKNYLFNDMPVSCRNSWFNPCSCRRLNDRSRDFLFSIFSNDKPDTRVSGFKGIRWSRHMDDSDCELSDLFDWMSSVLDARFIFLTRNPEEVCRSAWHVKNPDRCRSNCIEFTEYVSKYLMDSSFSDRWFKLHFKTLHDKEYLVPERFERLFSWLGERFDSRKVKDVLDVKWGY